MMCKLLIIGVDGLDSILLYKFKKYLPNIKRLKETSLNVKITSVFPPDSIPAWGSIYTGLNPAEHGIINFKDPYNKEREIIFKELHKYYRERTFWDIASKNGKRVCILLPYSIYPPWPVKGVMVCRSLEIVGENFPLKAYPEEIYDTFGLSDFKVNLFHGFPSKRDLRKFIEMCRSRTLSEAELGLRFLKNYYADLYFIYFSAIDAIQHTFWNYFDEAHPDYPGKNKYQSVIKDFYVLFDEILGKYLDTVDDKTTTIVLSDHGHGMRPVNLVNVNEILRRRGFLRSNVRKDKFRKRFTHREKLNKLLFDLVGIFGIRNFTLKFFDKFPILKMVTKLSNNINWEDTLACVSTISGLKAYSEGGVIINRNFVGNNNYERMRTLIIKELREIKDPLTGENLMKWVCRREELYKGMYIFKYPDILFELKKGFGVGLNIYGEIIEKSSMTRFQPGSHLRYSPVFLISNLRGKKYFKKDITLMDVKQIVLGILGLKE